MLINTRRSEEHADTLRSLAEQLDKANEYKTWAEGGGVVDEDVPKFFRE